MRFATPAIQIGFAMAGYVSIQWSIQRQYKVKNNNDDDENGDGGSMHLELVFTGFVVISRLFSRFRIKFASNFANNVN